MATLYTQGGLNAFIPTAEKSLQSNFSRNYKSFLLNNYVTNVKVDSTSFYDTYHVPDEESRINPSTLSNHYWQDGTLPQLNFTKAHQFTQHTCVRTMDMFYIGDVAQATAKNNWDLITDHSNSAASNLMAIRTYQALTLMTTAANWGSNTETATSLGGGKWNVASDPPDNYIQIAIQAAYQQIMLGTNATVLPQDICLIISPALATVMSQTTEIRNYLKSSPYAMEFLENRFSNGYAYGLPNYLYGVCVIVEPTVVNTAQLGQTANFSFMLGESNAILVSRPGTVTGPLNTQSAVTMALYEDLTIVMEHNALAKLTTGVLSQYNLPILRPQLGYLITACV